MVGEENMHACMKMDKRKDAISFLLPTLPCTHPKLEVNLTLTPSSSLSPAINSPSQTEKKLGMRRPLPW